MKQADILQLIKNDDDITLENLYRAKYTSTTYMSNVENVGNIENVDEEIGKIFKAQNIEDTKENKKIAKVFLENRIDITTQNVKEYKTIENVIENIDESKIVTEAVGNIKKGIKNIYINDDVKKINEEKIEEKVTEIQKNIKSVDIDDIKSIIVKKQIVNIKNIVNESKKTENIIISSAEVDIKAVKIKLQIEEIRLKLTVESAIKLRDKGINIETEPVKKVIDELKQIEKQVDITIGGSKITVGESSADKLKELYEKIDILKTRKLDVYTNVIKNKIFLNIDNLSNEVLKDDQSNPSIDAAKSIKTYEQMETRPDARFGDNFRKVESQINYLLSSQDIEQSEINIKCSKTLIKNNMEVNKENIEAIKVYESKVSEVVSKLHPTISLEIMNENKNPIEMHLDEMIEYIDGFKDKYGITTKEKLYDSLISLKQTDTIDKNQKDAIIAVYRALSTIDKAENVAVGLVIKKNIPITINNLLEATKYIQETRGKTGSIDLSIDDDFGMLEELKNGDNTISSKIQRALSDANFGLTSNNQKFIKSIENAGLEINNENIYKVYNEKNILNEFKNLANPERLQQLIDKNSNIMHMSIDNVNAEFKKMDTTDEDNKIYNDEKINKFLKNIESLDETKDSVLYALKKYDIKTTVKNIEMIKSFEKDFNFINKEYKNINNILKNLNIESKKLLRNNLDNIKHAYLDENIGNQIEIIKQEYIDNQKNRNDGVVDRIENVQKMLEISKNFQKQDEFYQIPIYLGDRLTNLNIYMHDDKNQNKNQNKNSGKNIFVSMDTETLGDVRIDIKIKTGNVVDLKINTENKQDKEFIRENLGEIQKLIGNLGYKTDKIAWQNQKLSNPIFDTINEEMRKYKESKYEEVV
ncbi:MAG TPA: hypothetical protein DEG71_11065 [Clostridiales bacterium]|nr:hypothetical protein [Clostridiales bacterium]